MNHVTEEFLIPYFKSSGKCESRLLDFTTKFCPLIFTVVLEYEVKLFLVSHTRVP